MSKNRNTERSKITDIKINSGSDCSKLYKVTIENTSEVPMSSIELANYVNSTCLKNLKDKKIKTDD